MTAAGYIKAFFRSFVDFFRDGGIMLAGSLSYFSVMAIIPFCLFIITIFGYFLGERQEFYQFFLAKLISFFPRVTSGITEELRRIITYKGLGKITIVLYGVLSYQLFSSLENAINEIFRIKAKRSFIVSFVLSLLVVTLIIVFLSISFGATYAISMLEVIKKFVPDLEISGITRFILRYVIPLVLLFAISATLYKVLPEKKIRLSEALRGALFTSFFLEAAKHFFAFYVLKVVRLGSIYGSLSVFIIFLLWVFYSSCIFLIGAELVKNLGRPTGKTVSHPLRRRNSAL